MKEIIRKSLIGLSCLAIACSTVVGQESEKKSQSQNQAGASSQSGQEKQQPVELSAGQLSSKPEQYIGKTVKINAEVEKSIGENWFTLKQSSQQQSAQAAQPKLLVLIPSAAKEAPTDQKVTVTGKVLRLVKSEIERDYNWIKLTPEVEVEITSRPIIVATSVTTSDGTQLVQAGTDRENEAAGGASQKETEKGTGGAGSSDKKSSTEKP